MPVADLRGVPFFLKGFVRGKFPKERDQWVLLDWKGAFFTTYDLQSGVCNILLFSPAGHILQKYTVTEMDLGILNDILEIIHEHDDICPSAARQ